MWTSYRCIHTEATYFNVVSDAPAFDTVPARRRPDSTGRLVMPASLAKDELALLCLPDLEKLLLLCELEGGSKRRENILSCCRRRRWPKASTRLHPDRLGSLEGRVDDSARSAGQQALRIIVMRDTQGVIQTLDKKHTVRGRQEQAKIIKTNSNESDINGSRWPFDGDDLPFIES
jgi:hypothetical protein